LRHDNFLRGDTTTDFIERFDPPLRLELSEAELEWSSCAGALWLQGERRVNSVVLSQLPSGWRNARLPSQRTSLRLDDRPFDVDYRARRDGSFDLGERGVARIHDWSESAIDAEINGRRASARVTRSHEHLYVQTLRGTATFEIMARFEVRHAKATPGGLNAPMPGLILDVRVKAGQRVAPGETLVVMEAMKMEHVISAPHAGTVNDVLVTKGQQVDRGVALLTLDPDAVSEE
jgi:propionyl-CoA carboxylase alpha chain